jgi:hypothetical protein
MATAEEALKAANEAFTLDVMPPADSGCAGGR